MQVLCLSVVSFMKLITLPGESSSCTLFYEVSLIILHALFKNVVYQTMCSIVGYISHCLSWMRNRLRTHTDYLLVDLKT